MALFESRLIMFSLCSQQENCDDEGKFFEVCRANQKKIYKKKISHSMQSPRSFLRHFGKEKWRWSGKLSKNVGLKVFHQIYNKQNMFFNVHNNCVLIRSWKKKIFIIARKFSLFSSRIKKKVDFGNLEGLMMREKFFLI